MSVQAPTDEDRQSRLSRGVMKLLEAVDRAGNKLPHPFWIFVGLAVIVALLSALFARLDLSSVNPTDGKTVAVKSLLTSEGIQMMLDGAIENFVNFPPLEIGRAHV